MRGLAHLRYLKLAAVAALLLVSLPSSRLIPFHRFWGLDLHNHQAFHLCAAKNNPYLMTGPQCRDDGWRDMYYPPLLYFAFAWTRLVSLPVAVRIWAVAIALGTLLSLLAWIRRPQWRGVGAPEIAGFGLLLTAQFPVVFAIERGNSDVLVLALWTAAMALFARGRFASSGFVAGTSAAMKLYSVFGCFVTGVGLIGAAVADRRLRPALARYAAAGALAVVVAVLAFLPQTRAYLADEFPRYAVDVTPLFVYSHSLQHVLPEAKWLAMLLFAALLAIWTVAGVRLIRSDAALVFAGGLALSTYFAATSYDYNLLTTYPLLLLLFLRAFDRSRPQPALPFVLLLLGLFAIVGPRSLFASSDFLKKAHILLQWGWLMAVGLAARRVATQEGEGASQRATD